MQLHPPSSDVIRNRPGPQLIALQISVWRLSTFIGGLSAARHCGLTTVPTGFGVWRGSVGSVKHSCRNFSSGVGQPPETAIALFRPAYFASSNSQVQ